MPDKEDLSVHTPNRQQQMIQIRLREAIKNGGGYTAVLERVDIAPASLNRYLKGHEMKVSTAIELAAACNVSPQWLLFGDENKEIREGSHSEVLGLNHASIPQYKGNASAGNGSSVANEDAYDFIKLSRNSLPTIVLNRLSNLVAVTVRGDSMSPSLYDCDTIFVDTKDRSIITGCVYVLRRDSDLLVKRLSWSVSGDLIVSSDNPLYKPEEISASRARQLFEDGGLPISIVGRVIWRMGIMGAR